MLPQTFLKKIADVPHIHLAGDTYAILTTGKETNGAYAAFEFNIPPGGGPPPHTHTREEEMFFITEGELTFYVDGKKVSAPQGSFVHAQRNIPHYFKNESQAQSKALVWVQPAGIEEMFLQVGQPTQPGVPPAPPKPEEIQKLIALAPKYGVKLHLEKH